MDRVVPSAMPLMVLKPAGSSGPLRISDAPTAITDIPATILDLLGLPSDAVPGQSVFRQVDDGVGRSRVYAEHSWTNAGWKLPYFDVLRLFTINGSVLDPNAWTYQRAIFEPSDDIDAQLEQYRTGLFPEEEEGDGVFQWGAPQVITYVPPDARLVVVEARRAPNVSPVQQLVVRVDGQVTARHQLAGDGWIRLEQALPSRGREQDPFCVELLVDPSWRGDDRRRRGAMFRHLEWER